MKLNLAQTKFVGLTMKLDLKSREYKMLCDKLEKYKNEKIDSNDERLYELLGQFQKNHDEIVEIKRQLKEIENIEEINLNEDNYKYYDIFKQKNKNEINTSTPNNEKMMVEYKENIWEKFKKIIQKIFKF